MNYEEMNKIRENTALWNDIKNLYQAYVYPTKKQLGIQPNPCYTFLWKARNAD